MGGEMIYNEPSALCRVDPCFTADPKLRTPIEEAFHGASHNDIWLKTLNVFAELNKIPSDKKGEYIKTVVRIAQNENISLEVEGFKKTLSSLSVREVGGF